MDFHKLKAQDKDSLQTARAHLAAAKGGNRRSDDRFWQPTVDKAGNGMAIIRFLPCSPDEEDKNFIKLFDHGFQGPGGWYIENSLTTFDGQTDPVTDFNSKLWNSTTDEKSPEREQVRRQKRRLHYISNIYVVNDPSNEDNNGKVFLFKYGKKIMDKIEDAMKEENKFGDEKAFDPFSLWSGANFRLKIAKGDGGFRNYDKSTFDTPGPLLKDADKLKEIHDACYPLQPFHDPSNFKSYAELKAKLIRVLGGTDADEASVTRRATDHEEELGPKAGKTREIPQSHQMDDDDDESNDEEMKYFKSLAS